METNHKILIGVVVALFIIILGAPVAMQFTSGGGKKNQKKVEIPNIPPALDAASLTNSIWEIEPQRGIKVQVTFLPNGEAKAFTANILVKKMAGTDTLPGKRSVQGAKFHVSTNFKGKDYQTDLVIAGTNIYAKEGLPIARIR